MIVGNQRRIFWNALKTILGTFRMTSGEAASRRVSVCALSPKMSLIDEEPKNDDFEPLCPREENAMI